MVFNNPGLKAGVSQGVGKQGFSPKQTQNSDISDQPHL